MSSLALAPDDSVAPEDVITPARGLRGSAGLDEVEARMIHLAVGARFDLLGAMVQEHLATGGGRTRARLALAAADALGVPTEKAVGWAAACELVHNATLVHDDLQDGDRVRRGRPALWARYGAAQAINVGDLLLMLPFRAVEATGADETDRAKLMFAVAEACEATVRGQSREMTLLARGCLDWDSWSHVAEGKSGALLALPVRGAAILARVAMTSVKALSVPFAALGVLYQAHDDVRDLWGDKGRGQRGNDLREGKPSAVVAAHLELHPTEQDALVRTLSRPRADTTDAEVSEWIARFEAGGALARVRRRIEALEARVLRDPALLAVPDLHALAATMVGELRAQAPVIGVRA